MDEVPRPSSLLALSIQPAFYLGGGGRGWVHKDKNSSFSPMPSLFDHSFYLSSFLCEQNLKCES